jgi:hypothetical protein
MQNNETLTLPESRNVLKLVLGVETAKPGQYTDCGVAAI